MIGEQVMLPPPLLLLFGDDSGAHEPAVGALGEADVRDEEQNGQRRLCVAAAHAQIVARRLQRCAQRET